MDFQGFVIYSSETERYIFLDCHEVDRDDFDRRLSQWELSTPDASIEDAVGWLKANGCREVELTNEEIKEVFLGMIAE